MFRVAIVGFGVVSGVGLRMLSGGFLGLFLVGICAGGFLDAFPVGLV